MDQKFLQEEQLLIPSHLPPISCKKEGFVLLGDLELANE